jgi:membrane protease YdiL (CAAX protease family)
MNLLNQPKNTSLLIISAIIIGVIITVIFSALIFLPYIDITNADKFDVLTLPREKIISMQAINMIGFFIVPPILFALFSKNDFIPTFNLDKVLRYKTYALAALIAVTLFPILINLQYWVSELPLSDAIKEGAEAQQALSEKIMGIFLSHPGIENLLLMILIIGIGAGLTEELFFRGLLMPWIEKLTGNAWLSILLSGSIFSLFHSSFYQFLPIAVVGILFGYLYHKTKDLKLNIFIHALYNSLQVVLNYLYENKIIQSDIEEIKSVPILLWIVCLILVSFLIYKLVEDHEHISHTS